MKGLHRLMNRRYRRLRLVIFVAVLSVGYVGIIFPSVIWNSYTSDLVDLDESRSARMLLSTKDNITGFQYPPDAFDLEQRKDGAIVLYILGVIYMFVALAIVCDEYFVPSLSVIIERVGISEDVAGATFMAAGGSAPELFTSFIGVFLARNNVGIGTIVGSAVFNILFVIGMCAIVSKTVLDLTWWPLFRDVTFYSISLILLIVFFQDEVIKWPESLGLFSCYIVYVIFMKYNENIEAFVKRKIKRRKSRIHTNDNGLINEKPNRSCSIPILHSGTNHFRHGVLQLMIHTIDPISEGKVHEKAIKLRAVANLSMDESNPSSPVQNGVLKNGEVTNGNVMFPDRNDTRGKTLSEEQDKRNGNLSDNNRNRQIQVHAISNGHMPGDSPVPASASPASNRGSNFMYRTWPPDEEIGVTSPGSLDLYGLNRTSNTTEVTSLDSPRCSAGNRTTGESTDSESQAAAQHRTEIPKEPDEPLDMSWPSSWRRRLTYVIVSPLMFPMWLTLPDTRRPEKKKWYICTFIGSILWIGGFSYLMVWWANTTGETIGIPNEVMGLTILAAGTSIPDLITSVIVAKKGYGDMAVSSSVGSNIFDITVGLPVPWLLYSLIYDGAAIDVDSFGLVCSILMLFAMLLTVVITIAVSKWKMTKPMGVSMLVLYCAFVVLSVLLELQVVHCPMDS